MTEKTNSDVRVAVIKQRIFRTMCPHRFQIKVLKAKANYTFPYLSMIFIRRKKSVLKKKELQKRKGNFGVMHFCLQVELTDLQIYSLCLRTLPQQAIVLLLQPIPPSISPPEDVDFINLTQTQVIVSSAVKHCCPSI